MGGRRFGLSGEGDAGGGEDGGGAESVRPPPRRRDHPLHALRRPQAREQRLSRLTGELCLLPSGALLLSQAGPARRQSPRRRQDRGHPLIPKGCIVGYFLGFGVVKNWDKTFIWGENDHSLTRHSKEGGNP